MPDPPVVVVLGLTLQQPTLDDAVLELVERDLDVALLEGVRPHEALLDPEELEVATVEPLDVVRVDRVLHDLQPRAREHGVSDVPDPVHHEAAVAGQLGGGGGTDVGEHLPPELLSLARERLHLVREAGGVRLRRLVEARAVRREHPAVVPAAQAVGLHPPVDRGGVAVGTVLLNDPVVAVGRPPQGEVLALR